MSESDEFSRLSIHKSFCVPARRWEAQQEGRALAWERDSLIPARDGTARPVGMGEPRLSGSRCVRSALGEKRMLYGKGVFHRRDNRVINAWKEKRKYIVWEAESYIAFWGSVRPDLHWASSLMYGFRVGAWPALLLSSSGIGAIRYTYQ